MKLHLFEPHLHTEPSGEARQLSIGRKQCQRHGPLALLIEDFDRSAPAFALTVVDLSKVEHLPLNNLTTPAAAILHNVPIAMHFAVFDPCMVPQEHYGHRFYAYLYRCEEPWSALPTTCSSRSFI
jgi:hypothetical protein